MKKKTPIRQNRKKNKKTKPNSKKIINKAESFLENNKDRIKKRSEHFRHIPHFPYFYYPHFLLHLSTESSSCNPARLLNYNLGYKKKIYT